MVVKQADNMPVIHDGLLGLECRWSRDMDVDTDRIQVFEIWIWRRMEKTR